MKRFSNILFIADSSADDSAALSRAEELANNNQAQLTVVGLVEVSEREKNSSDARTKQLLGALVQQRHDELKSLMRESSSVEALHEIKVLIGKGFLEVIREVLRNDRDLVVKSAESTDGIAEIFGSTDLKLLRKCPCPVWVIKSTHPQGYRQILVALDYDPEDAHVDMLNGQILEMATSLALSDFAELHVVHAWRLAHESFMRSARSALTKAEVDEMLSAEENTRRQWLEALVNRHCAAQGEETVDYLKPQIHLLKGSASQLVPALSEKLDAELIVMGTVGRAGIPGFLVGNTAEDILHQIRCSVLAVKPAGFVSPVRPEG